jgi:hypothetical protein
MTVDIPTRAPEQAPEGGGRRGLKGGPQITFGRSPRSNGKAPLVVGAQPRANLLPPEIILKRKQLKTRRALRFGVVLVAIATGAACVATFGVSTAASVQLLSVQQQQNTLVLEQAKYQEVRDVQLTIDTIKAGQEVGASTEINWREFLTELQGKLPKGVTLQIVKAEAGSPMSVYLQSDAPLLQGQRVAGIAFTAYSKTLPDIPDWLRGLQEVTGYVDAIPGSVKQEGSGYTAEVLMHINEEAFSLRYDPAHVAAAEAAEAAAAKSDGTIKSLTAKAPASDGAADGSAADEEGEN